MNRLLLSLTFVFLFATSLTAKERPNIILIMLDDSGWTDFGCFGSQIDTPNIDRAAKEGMRFTDCHSAAPNCSPSRVGMLTGRTPSRVGMYSYRPPAHAMHLLDKEVTIPELLKAEGYHTGHFGKWHLSTLMDEAQPNPGDQGYDYWLGTDNNAAPNHHNPVNFVRNGKAVPETDGYSCQLVVEEAMDWLDQISADKSDKPFFATVWYHEPHTPIASPPELVKKYQDKFPKLSKKDAAYHANIENVDIATGRLLDRIKELGIDKKTFVFITSDNGGLNGYSNQGLRGKKSNVWEGGHRVPGIFRWPGKIPAGTESAVPVSATDLLPTICEFTDTKAPADRKIDGVSLAKLLSGEATTLNRKEPLYWFFYRLNPALALREGKWSLIADTNDAQRPKTHGLIEADMPFIKNSRPEKFLLFDLESDLAQKKDVSAQHPEVLERLKKEAIRIHSEVMAEGPDWKIPGGNSKSARVWDSY